MGEADRHRTADFNLHHYDSLLDLVALQIRPSLCCSAKKLRLAWLAVLRARHRGSTHWLALDPNRNLLANLDRPIDFKRYYSPKNLAAKAIVPMSNVCS